VKRLLFGRPRDLTDQSVFHRLALVPLLAWIGLGADGLSSSSYGPDEAFRTLGPHTYLAVGLAFLTTVTVLIIAAAYSRIIEEFPQGGGGYVVATKLLGEHAGVVSGCALLVDYMLTITVSVAAAGDAMFSMLPLAWHGWKLPSEVFFIAGLVTLNLRGVRESVLALAPIFLLFVITHLGLLIGGIVAHLPEVPATARAISADFHAGLGTLRVGGMLWLFIHAYSLGGGTYTGIEAVSNGLPIMREPRVRTGQRTMLYMSVSLAATAAGLLICYLLWRVVPTEGKTMNAVLVERVAAGLPLGHVFIVLTLFAEGALLIVAAQAGFIDGPRVLANMAVDSWVPRRFAALSERLTTANGVVLMGAVSLAALLYTHGDVRRLVVMYSINVFLTFSLSMAAMTHLWLRIRTGRPHWKRKGALFVAAFLLCATVLVTTLTQKFTEGGWLTVLGTGTAIVLCVVIRRHYRTVSAKLTRLYVELERMKVPETATPGTSKLDPRRPTAALLVGAYSGVGLHSLLNVFRAFPGFFKNVVFLSVGVVDSGAFKGEHAVEHLRESTERTLDKYVAYAHKLGVPATYRVALGTDAVDEAEQLCQTVAREFPTVTFFAGQLVFGREAWYQRILHNDTAFALQRRLQWAGKTMVILPARVVD
jgi:hypothetical protein